MGGMVELRVRWRTTATAFAIRPSAIFWIVTALGRAEARPDDSLEGFHYLAHVRHGGMDFFTVVLFLIQFEAAAKAR